MPLLDDGHIIDIEAIPLSTNVPVALKPELDLDVLPPDIRSREGKGLGGPASISSFDPDNLQPRNGSIGVVGVEDADRSKITDKVGVNELLEAKRGAGRLPMAVPAQLFVLGADGNSKALPTCQSVPLLGPELTHPAGRAAAASKFSENTVTGGGVYSSTLKNDADSDAATVRVLVGAVFTIFVSTRVQVERGAETSSVL